MKSQETAVLAGQRHARKGFRLPWKRYRLAKTDPIVISAILTLTGDASLRDERDQVVER